MGGETPRFRRRGGAGTARPPARLPTLSTAQGPCRARPSPAGAAPEGAGGAGAEAAWWRQGAEGEGGGGGGGGFPQRAGKAQSEFTPGRREVGALPEAGMGWGEEKNGVKRGAAARGCWVGLPLWVLDEES